MRRAQDIETTVRRETQIDRPEQPAGEGPGHGRLSGVERLDPAVIEIAKEVLAAVLLRPGQVRRCEGRADDARCWIVVDRAPETRVGRRPTSRSGPVPAAGSLFRIRELAPTVVMCTVGG